MEQLQTALKELECSWEILKDTFAEIWERIK